MKKCMSCRYHHHTDCKTYYEECDCYCKQYKDKDKNGNYVAGSVRPMTEELKKKLGIAP